MSSQEDVEVGEVLRGRFTPEELADEGDVPEDRHLGDGLRSVLPCQTADHVDAVVGDGHRGGDAVGRLGGQDLYGLSRRELGDLHLDVE